MNKSETFKNRVLYIWFVTVLVIAGIVIGESVNLIDIEKDSARHINEEIIYENSPVRYINVFRSRPATNLISIEDAENFTEQKTIITDEIIFERIVEKGKDQMTYNFIKHSLYDTLFGS